jgi:diguanylate cyclase (GGDEF)-like protein
MDIREWNTAPLWHAATAAAAGALLGQVAHTATLATGLALVVGAWAWTARRTADPPTGGGAAAIVVLPDRAAEEDPGLAVIDALTGLSNRRGLERVLDGECRRAARAGTPVGVIVLSVRDFDLLREVNGAEAAREALRHTGRCLRQVLGSAAAVGRWSGGEFVAVLPGVRPDALPMLAERFRRLIESQPVMAPGGGRVPVRVATGWAASPRDGISGSFLVSAARGRGPAGPAPVLVNVA